MKSIIHHKDIAGIEVMNITKYGLWLLTSDSELFISFQGFPQFLDASVSKIMKVEQPNPNLLHWPDLGIDLAIQSVRRFPLVSKPSIPRGRSHQRMKVGPTTQSKSQLRLAQISTSPKEQDTTCHAKSDEEGTSGTRDK